MRCIFGHKSHKKVELTALGHISRKLDPIPQPFGRVKLHWFVIMPNQLHGIIEIAATGWGSMLRRSESGCKVYNRGRFPQASARLRLR
jgi:hypothetical protein